MLNVIITVHDGLISDVDVPEGVKVEVRDYDIDGTEENLCQDLEGEEYSKSLHIGGE